jgi:hypothetical protein
MEPAKFQAWEDVTAVQIRRNLEAKDDQIQGFLGLKTKDTTKT